jgi:pyrroline-5-carboxylate reductase
MKIVFVGAGNMARALIAGLLQSPTVPGTAGRALARGVMPPQLHAIDPGPEARMALMKLAEERQMQHLVSCAATADSAVQDADVVVLAVKPQMMREACRSLVPFLKAPLIVSVAAGIRSRELSLWLDGSQRIVRCMPNTPALIGKGITGAFALVSCSEADRAMATGLLEPTGPVIWMPDESGLDAVTALSGSGPAYVFYFMEAMLEAAAAMGLTPEAARALVLHTFEGASELALASDEPPAVLRERVTSKGGTTFAALESMRTDRVAQAVEAAVLAARRRAVELGDAAGG